MNIESFKKIGVIGFKQSGISLCNLALSLGKMVKVSELDGEQTFSPYLLKECKQRGVEFEFGQHSAAFLKGCDVIVASPGVDIMSSALDEVIKRLGVLTVGEVEFASWFNKGKIIAITGTNGKTTTTFLTYRALESGDKKVYLAGNIGIPFSSLVRSTTDNDLIVLELSSFQLETIREFRPYVSCITNLEPDHFDRYAKFEEYVRAKRNIFNNQKESDFAVLNRSLKDNNPWIHDIKASIVYFDNELGNENFSAAYAIASVFGVTQDMCRKVFSSFKGLPHRMQFVRTVRGVTFINDSKATNPSSTMWALRNITQPTILIAGGKDKGLDYSQIISSLSKVKKINLFGEARDAIRQSLRRSQKRTEVFVSLRDAFISSFEEAKENDTILLSPMCSSFDVFANYRERGKLFVKLVQEIYENVK